MINSGYLKFVEYSLWVACISWVLISTYFVMKEMIKEDLKQSKNSDSIHRYSSILSMIFSAIVVIIVFRVSNYLLSDISFLNTNNIVSHATLFILIFAVGYSWMHLIVKKYNAFKRLNNPNANELSKNVIVFMVSTSFFALLLICPSLIQNDIPVVRILFLAVFLGALFRHLYVFSNESTISLNIRNKDTIRKR